MDLPMRQSLLLGAYLAYREAWVGRDELLALFWPDDDESTARHNLSQLVYHCRRQPWFDGIETERTRLRWVIDSDVQLFRAALGTGALHDALNLYSGPLLDGAPAGSSLGFEAWLERERETLHGAWRDASLAMAGECEGAGQWIEAVARLRPVLAQDPLAEDALQAYLRCAGPAGQRDAALRAFDAFTSQLRDELDLTPLEETLRLAELLRNPPAAVETASDRAAISQAGITEVDVGRGAGVRNFPAPLTPFVGREALRTLLEEMLVRDGARLVTLLGPGGSGKTRLAVEVARGAADAFRHGAVFVPLAEAADPGLVPQAFLNALGLQAPAGTDPEAFLTEWLAPRSLLLVVDNLEHLLTGAGLVPELLEASPGSAALVTSREPVDVYGEVIVEVPGLDYPKASEEPGEAFDAVTLFVRSARRANPQFVIDAGDRADIASLCRLLEGMPLGIELAAAWMRLLQPGEVAAALTTSLDLLATTAPDVPARQRSVRATLDHSWDLLNDEERSAWVALSVFKGGFAKDAADQVAGSSLRTLLALVNKSLLFRTSDGRFEQLIVIRQYGVEKLRADPEQLAAVAGRHATHFVSLTEQAREGLAGDDQAAWLVRLARDHGNLRAALDHLRDTRAEQAALAMANGLLRYWWLRGHYREARDVFESVLLLSDDRSALRATAMSNAGAVARLCEDFQGARRLMSAGLAVQRELGDPAALASALGNLANLIRAMGEYDEAERLLLESLQLFRSADQPGKAANTLNNLGVLATYRNDPVTAERFYQEAYDLAQSAGEELVAALALGNLAASATARGDLERARTLLTEALTVFDRLEYQVGMAVTDQHIADIALQTGDLEEARGYYVRAARRFSELGDQRGIAEVLGSLVSLAAGSRDWERVLRCAGAALGLHEQLGLVMPDGARQALDGHVAAAREQVGAAHAADLTEEGERLTSEARLALALSG